MIPNNLKSYLNAADRERSLTRYGQLAESYDHATTRIERIRQAAIAELKLRPGDSVLDVGCGTGKALPLLIEKVGRNGRVVGVEQCPEMAAVARRQTSSSGIRFGVIVAPVEEFESEEKFDAMLLSFTQDVLQNAAAVSNLIAHAKPGTRFAVAGMRFLPWWWAAPLNIVNAFRARHYMTTFRGLREPWRPLLEYCPDLSIVDTWFAGSCYLAVGRVAGSPSARD